MAELNLDDLDMTNTNNEGQTAEQKESLLHPSDLLGKALRVILKQREHMFTSVGPKTFVGPAMKGVKRQMFTDDDGDQCIKSLGRKAGLDSENVYNEIIFHIDNPRSEEADAINEFLHYLS